MNTVYIDGKLVPQDNIIAYFSDEVKEKFNERALKALIALLTSEVCENHEGTINVDNKDVLDGLKIRWDGLTDEDRELIENDQLLAWEMESPEGAYIVFPERWSTYMAPVGEMIIRLEGQFGFEKKCIHPTNTDSENWYLTSDGKTLCCDVDLVFILPWLEKRVRLAGFGRYEIHHQQDKRLWAPDPMLHIVLSVSKCQHDGIFDLMDHGFIEDYVARLRKLISNDKCIEIIQKELNCDFEMAYQMMRTFYEQFGNAGEETCELVLHPNIKRDNFLVVP